MTNTELCERDGVGGEAKRVLLDQSREFNPSPLRDRSPPRATVKPWRQKFIGRATVSTAKIGKNIKAENLITLLKRLTPPSPPSCQTQKRFDQTKTFPVGHEFLAQNASFITREDTKRHSGNLYQRRSARHFPDWGRLRSAPVCANGHQ